nr:cupin domain-containing protein [Streptomyces sp. CBMA152]
MRLLGEGATLLLPQLDQWHASVGALAAHLAHDLGRRVEAFCFATMAGRRGLDVHRDDADVLVVQVAGRKEWTVYAAPTDGHWRPGPVPEPGEPVLRTVVGAGDVLYVPRGAPHTATGNEGLSVHIALTVREASTAHIRRTLADLLTQDPGDLPTRPLTEAQLLASIRDVLDSARKTLDSVSPEDLLARARGPLPDLPGTKAPTEWPTA